MYTISLINFEINIEFLVTCQMNQVHSAIILPLYWRHL